MVSVSRMCGELQKISEATEPNLQNVYIWRITDFTLCYKNSGIGHVHESPPFFIGLNNEYQWTLDIYIAGCDRENIDYVGIHPFLRQAWTHKNIKFAVEISLSTKSDETIFTRKATLTDENIHKSDGMFKDFALRRDLLNESGLLSNNELKLVFKICIGEPNISDQAIALQRTHESSQKILEKLWECRQFSDFKLIIGNKEFCVHRAILATASPVFQAMFESNMREASEGKVAIQDVETSVMEKTLYFIYVDKLNDAGDLIDKILEVAEKYQLDSLKQLCENILVEQLSVENVYETLLLADRNNAETLKKQAIEFFLKNAKKLFISSANFKTSIERLPINLQTEIICAFVANL